MLTEAQAATTASALAEEVRWGLAAARAAGDLPDPRLALLASEVSAGRYWIDAREVAAALLEDLRDRQLATIGVPALHYALAEMGPRDLGT